jgi:hypothetical protein
MMGTVGSSEWRAVLLADMREASMGTQCMKQFHGLDGGNHMASTISCGNCPLACNEGEFMTSVNEPLITNMPMGSI